MSEGLEILISKISQEERNLIKQIKLENLDISQLHNFGITLTKEECINIFIKLIDTDFRIHKGDLIRLLISCISVDQNEELEKELLNIYPGLQDDDWYKFGYVRKIENKGKNNRQQIKDVIQKDGRCFSTKIRTSLVGKTQEGKKIPVNNLSKWLFGVPGAKGHLMISKDKKFILVPMNTPDEAIQIIEESIEHQKEESRLAKEAELQHLMKEEKIVTDLINKSKEFVQSKNNEKDVNKD